MLRKSLLIFCLGLVSAGCIGIKLTVCIVDPPSNGLQCYDKRTEKGFFVPMKEAENYIAMPSGDYEKLLNYSKNKCR